MVGKYITTKRRQVSVGDTYGWLEVQEFAGRNKHGNLTWECSCQCGSSVKVTSSNLLGGTNPSCGCYKTKILIDRNTTHGASDSSEYVAWCGMRQRCLNPSNSDYESYGGRGIAICPRWDSFPAFLSDMGPCSPGDTLERLDNSGNYEPGNCIWASRKVQARNKRNVPLYRYKGQNKCVAEWAEIYGIHPETLRGRLKRGWPIAKALATPIRPIKGVHC